MYDDLSRKERRALPRPEDPKLSPRAPASLDDVRAIDLVACPSCGAVLSLGDVEKVERRTVPVYDENHDEAVPFEMDGVFCRVPGCGQRLFDTEGWTNHKAERLYFDRQGATPAATAPASPTAPELVPATTGA